MENEKPKRIQSLFDNSRNISTVFPVMEDNNFDTNSNLNDNSNINDVSNNNILNIDD